MLDRQQLNNNDSRGEMIVKRTFWTRNVFIGVLMGLVMVLGVQDTIDALSFRESRTGDLQTIVMSNEFTVSLTVVLGSNTTAIRNASGQLVSDDGSTRINSSGYPIVEIAGRVYRASTAADSVSGFRRPVSGETGDQSATGAHVVDGSSDSAAAVVDSEGRAIYTTDGGGTRATAAPDAKHSDADRYHYNEESISISVPTGTTLTKVGNYRVNVAGGSAHPMNELSSSVNENKLTSSLRLTFRADTVGAKIITISDTTDATDRPTSSVSQPLSFTIFVVPSLDISTNLDFTSAVTNGYAIGNDNADPPINTRFSGGTNAPLVYRVEGSGRLYIRETYTGDAAGSPMSRSSATQTLSTSSDADVYLDMNGSSNKVTAYVRDRNAAETGRTVAFIFNYATIEIISGNNQTGVLNSRLRDPLHIRVKDSRGRAVPGLAVTFTPGGGATLEPVIGTDVYLTASTASPANAWAATFATIDRTFPATRTVPANISPDTAALVPTNRSGEAQVYLEVGAAGEKTVAVSAGGATNRFYATSSASTDIPSLEILSGNNQRSASDGKVADPLVVRVLASNNQPLPTQTVTFTTTKGYLTTTSGYELSTDPVNGPATQVKAQTDVNGKASVRYDLVEHSGAADVIAEISGTSPPYQRRVTFNINGGSSTRPPITRDPVPPAATNRIGISLSSSTGEPGDEITVTVRSDPTGRTVRLTSDDFADSLFSPQSETTPFESTLTLPDEEGEYTITAEGFPLEAATATVTVETGNLGSITISAIGAPSNGTQLFTITVRDTDGTRISSALTVRVSGSGFTARNVETSSGIGDVRLTLPTTSALYTLTASAANYESGTTQVRGTGSPPPPPPPSEPEEEPEEEPEVQEPDSISIVGPSQRTGTANSELEAALIVRILDEDDNPIEDARVIFRVRKGQGRLSQRGNGRAIADQTDEDGYARAEYTPMSASSTVEAQVRAVRDPVTFTITTDGSVPSTDTPDTDRDTPGTDEDTTTISPTVLIPPAQRPPMVWVDGGAIYALIGTEVQEFIPNLTNVMNLAIGGGKVYWTEKTGASAGTINAANLDGSGKTELTSIRAIPIGIAVDTPNSKLYWTNSRGRIQSANLDGSGIQNVMQNIRNPNDLALAGGNVYWTESNHGSVRFVNLKGQKQVRVISTGDDPAGSLAIAGGKVYWTEKVGENGGTINSANLNGSGAKEIASILATPIGIAVDTARSKLYWTNARGRIQAASLDGSSIRNVVSGLGSPGEIVFSNFLKAPKATTTTPKSTTTAANKYDINGDGTVDVKDSDALIVAVAARVTDAKYDVNGDGKVNINDVIAVTANRSGGAASAPTLLGQKFSALEVERLQEQIDLLVASGDRSPAAMQTLIYLQQLIVMARPEKTQLLANYPNPFNPETWIPYELATDTDVRITIYNAQGVVVRTLHLGQQSAGYYTDRERAAYWDGRNALGEQVASGIYFYQLETDEMSALRKMVIVK